MTDSYVNVPLALSGMQRLPRIIAIEGKAASKRFIEFFTANIPNDNTRFAYVQAISQFFTWTEQRGFHSLDLIEPTIVAAYLMQHPGSKPTVKQHLAAIRMLFYWQVVGQVLPMNPAHAVRGPKHVVKKGKTPVLTAAEARQLLDSIDITNAASLRDRAIIGVMVYSFARVSAVVGMNTEDSILSFTAIGSRAVGAQDIDGDEHAQVVVEVTEQFIGEEILGLIGD